MPASIVSRGRVEYQLLSAVQDLAALFHQSGLTPPPDQLLTVHASAVRHLPAALEDFADIEELLRGAGCLLANGLSGAALPVLAEALRRTRELEVSLSGRLAAPLAQEYATLGRSIAAQPRNASGHYWLCGEVMAMYLDVLATVHDSAELRATTHSLRARLRVARPTE